MKLRTSIRAVLLAALFMSLSASAGIYAFQQAPPGPQKPVPPSPQSKPPQTSPPTAQEAQPGPETAITVESALVNLDVLVTDQDGRVLGGLKRENFRVLDDGKPQPITNFATPQAPITIVMLLEYSGIAYDYFAYKGAYWGTGFLKYLDPQDWVALVPYDMKPNIAVDFTHNKTAILDALQRLSYPSFREANLFDAVVDTLDRLERIKGKKSILIISTGADTFSEHTLDQTLRRLKEADITVFSVGVAEREYMNAGNGLSYSQAKNQLATFAKMTGGHSWFPRFDGELPSIFQSVAAFLRNQYRIGFSPENLPHDGKYHRLKVEIVDAGGKPLVVTNEKGKRRKVEIYAREGYVDTKQLGKK